MVSLILASTAWAAPEVPARLDLKSDWRLESSAEVETSGPNCSMPGYVDQGWHRTEVPATVLAALAADGTYPDPFYGLNLKAIPGYKEGRWLSMPEGSPFRVPWWYRTEFDAPAAWQGHELTLHVDGINYRATVWLNGERIANSDDVVGMFRRFEFSITGRVRLGGRNALAIEIIPPALLEDKPYHTKQLEATTGWDDHNPQPPDANMGIWQPVYITVSGPVRLKHPYVASALEVPSLANAKLTVSAYVSNLTQEAAKATVHGTIEGAAFEQEVALGAGETQLVTFTPEAFTQLVFAHPRVWWPNPLGAQELYDLDLAVDVAGAPSDTTHVRFGIRKATTYLNEENWRTYDVNGRKVLIRGGAWMTCDMLLRLAPERYDALVRYAREANLNMLRSEGFSIRETDDFYDACDEYGVMVTQQIFGRSIPDEKLAIACIEDTLLRIRNHPSLVHFLGHDETFPTESLDKAYRELIAKYTPDRTYQPHSGAFEVEERIETGGTRTGTRELWTYANPKHYYECKEDGAWGFAQSGGIGGIVAPFESVRRFIPREQRWPVWTEALSFHSVIQGGTFFDTVVKMLDARYGSSKSLEEFCRKAQALNYECARGMFEAYGRNKYSATGLTTWKYDAAWPAFMTWHYIDWHLNATGAYYGAKVACRATHVQYSYDDESIWVVNTLSEDFKALKAKATVYNADMTIKGAQEATVDVDADGKTLAFTRARAEGLSKSHFLRLTLEDASGERIDENVYWLSTTPDVRGTVRDDWNDFLVSPRSIADHTALAALPPARIEQSVKWSSEGNERRASVTLKNTSDNIAFQVHAAIRKTTGGDEVFPAFWSDNYICLFPGETRELEGIVYTRNAGESPSVTIDAWNLAQ